MNLAELRHRDYARYLSLWLIAADRRDFALAMFELEAELLAIPAKVTDPTVGLMRIVWWRDAASRAVNEAAASPLLKTLCLRDQADTALMAEWIETYDLPFLPETEQTGRLQERQDFEARLLGTKASAFIAKARQRQRQPILLAYQAFKAIWLGTTA